MNVISPPARLAGVSDQEWQLRCDLAALYRLIAHHRWTDFVYTHISARLPGPEHHFLINRYGVNFHQMRASDLVKIDLDGNVVDPHEQTYRVNAAGFTIHSAIHMARRDLMCVVHTHTAAGIAVSAQKHGLLPISQHALKFHGRLGYHGYEGIALDVTERERLVRDLGPDHKAMILRNHGLLMGGTSIPEAFHMTYMLERACQAQVAALAGGAELVFPPEEVCRHTAEQFRVQENDEHYAMVWSAALDLIENDTPDYRN
ncbi:MAG: class II aldolase/adducin family protein [Acetobacteraceae bacterium]